MAAFTPTPPSNSPVVRVTGFTLEVSVNSYLAAFKELLKVDSTFNSGNLKRGFFHMQVPQGTFDALFSEVDEREFKHSAGWSFRVRGRDANGEAYYIAYSKPTEENKKRHSVEDTEWGPEAKRQQTSQGLLMSNQVVFFSSLKLPLT